MNYHQSDSDHGTMVAQSTVQFDIKKFVYKIIGFLPWIILSLVIAYIAAKLYLRYTPEMHKVSSFLLIKDNEESSPDYNVLRELGVITSSKEIQNQIDILQSYELSEHVVDSLNLQVKLFTVGRIASLPLYGKYSPVHIYTVKNDSVYFQPASFQLFLQEDSILLIQKNIQTVYPYNDTVLLAGKKVYFVRNRTMKADDNGYSLIIADRHATSVALRAGISISKTHDPGGIVEVALLDQSAERGIDIINKLIETYNTAGVTDKNLVGFKTRHFLNDRVDTVAAELDELEQKAEAFKKQNRINDVSTIGSQYLGEAMKYDEQLAAQSGKLKLLESLEQFIKSSKNYSDIIPSDYGIGDATLGALIEMHNNDVLKYQQQVKISTVKDPVIGRLADKISDDKENLLKNILSVREGYDVNYREISNRKNNFDALLFKLPEKERAFLKLQRQIGVKEQLFLYLLQKKEEVEMSLNSTINNTRIVDYAFDQGVVAPKAEQVIMFALLIGLIIPVIVMLLLDFFNNKIADRKEIEEGSAIPIIGEISFSNHIKNKIIGARSRSGIAEQFRLICANLRYAASEQQSKIILITSFMSGEGKSFISANLSGSLSGSGARVLVIELDLRKPKLAKQLNVQAKYGLTDYLINAQPLNLIINPVEGFTNVDIITSGPVPPNPAELLMLPRLASLFAFAKENYEFIIVDTSPAGLVADVFLISRFADITLFIVRHYYSHKTTLEYAEKLYREGKLKSMHLVVNGIKQQRNIAYSYNYGYGYGYGYSYGYTNGSAGYYTEEDKPKNKWKRIFSFRNNNT